MFWGGEPTQHTIAYTHTHPHSVHTHTHRWCLLLWLLLPNCIQGHSSAITSLSPSEALTSSNDSGSAVSEHPPSVSPAGSRGPQTVSSSEQQRPSPRLHRRKDRSPEPRAELVPEQENYTSSRSAAAPISGLGTLVQGGIAFLLSIRGAPSQCALSGTQTDIIIVHSSTCGLFGCACAYFLCVSHHVFVLVALSLLIAFHFGLCLIFFLAGCYESLLYIYIYIYIYIYTYIFTHLYLPSFLSMLQKKCRLFMIM